MKTDTILSKREREVINLVVLGYSAREIAERLNVIYQCVANHLQSIYDKTGCKRTLHALVTWYFTQNFGITLNISEMTRRIGAAILLCLFSVELLGSSFECRMMRRARRRADDIELLTVIED
ncbi:response regulator transcription factor [Alistipes putredinis]|uniref:response regulator transcription factor n=1 Tax=Alistipes putredinis TaxID=28117 RepID=UPI003AB28E05